MAALDAARRDGWDGFFAENHLWRALFGLVFWEDLFADVPGAFQHRFQIAPLDIGSGAFYEQRREAIEGRLAELQSGPSWTVRLLATASAKWGLANAFVRWRTLDRSCLEEVVARIDAALLAGILRVMVRNPLAFDSGFPDLFLYRPGSGEWRLWEVKGPGDSLRPEQEWWIAHFNQFGGHAQVARVAFPEPIL